MLPMAVLLAASVLHAQVPGFVHYSGYLEQGGAAASGTFAGTFEIFDAPTTGSLLWSEPLVSLSVVNGAFDIELSVPPGIFDGRDLWLQVSINATPLAPRTPLGTAPFAYKAGVCDDSYTLAGLSATDVALKSELDWVSISNTPGLPSTACAEFVGWNGAAFTCAAAINAASLCVAGQYLDGDGTCQSVPTDTNAATLCSPGEYLDGDGTCKAIPVDTDTNAGTLCAPGQYLDGDGTCKAIPVDTNAGTLCAPGQYLDGDGTCKAVPVDTNAGTLCANGQYLDGDGTCKTVPTGVPTGAIMFFDSGTCPTGWSELPPAEGRYIVAVTSARTLAAAVGTALSNIENRTVGLHNHGVNDPGHQHKNRGVTNVSGRVFTNTDVAGFDGGDAGAVGRTTPSTTGITINNAGSVAGTNAPYIQLLACKKN